MLVKINESILVVRSGKRVKPTIGKSFDLTDDEMKQLSSVRPQAFSKIGDVEVDPQSTKTDNGGKTDVEDEVDLTKLNKAELTALAEEKGLTVAGNATKADIIEAITNADEEL